MACRIVELCILIFSPLDEVFVDGLLEDDDSVEFKMFKNDIVSRE